MSARFLGVSGSQAGDEPRKGSSSTKQKFSARFILGNFRDVTFPNLGDDVISQGIGTRFDYRLLDLPF